MYKRIEREKFNPLIYGLYLLRKLLFKGDHFDGGCGGFFAFVTVFAACSVYGLLQVVGGEDAEYYGGVVFEGHVVEALRHAVTDEVEVSCLALYDASEGYDGVYVGVFAKELRAEGQLERSGDMPYDDVFLFAPFGFEQRYGSFQQFAGYVAVPFGHYYAEAHVLGRWYR